MKPDVLVVWAKNNDFPLWRKQMTENMHRFNSLNVVFMEPNQGYDYSDFVRDEMQKIGARVMNSEPVGPGQDWRDVAIKTYLSLYPVDNWIWFTEQDFFFEPKFFEQVNFASKLAYVAAVYQDERMHPCSIFMHPKILKKLDLDFGIVPGKLDHFGKIQQQIEEKKITVVKLDESFYHFNGFSHNWKLIADGQRAVYHEDEFIAHLKLCFADEETTELHSEFVRVALKAIEEYDFRNK